MFSIPNRVYHTWYTLRLVNFDCLLQHVRQSFAVLLPDSNKHVEQVKPSYTAPFDVLTFEILSRETVFQEVGVFEYLKRWLQACPLLTSYLFWLIRYFTACSLFSRVRIDRKSGTGSGLTSFLVLIVVFFFTLQHQTGQTGTVGLPVVQLVEEV